MKSSASITLRKKPNKKGQYPLAIRITKFRKLFISTEKYTTISFQKYTILN